MEERLIKVGITHGDINGIGYEVILKTFSDARVAELCTPVIYGSSKIAAYHRKALELGITNSIASCTLMVELGEEIFFSIGAETNIKLTTQDDLKIFKALLTLKDANTRL